MSASNSVLIVSIDANLNSKSATLNPLKIDRAGVNWIHFNETGYSHVGSPKTNAAI